MSAIYHFFSTLLIGLVIFLAAYWLAQAAINYFVVRFGTSSAVLGLPRVESGPPSTCRPPPVVVSPAGRRLCSTKTGLIDFEVEITCAKQDLHSGSYGGSVPEAMADLTWLLAQLTDSMGNIHVPRIEEDLVQPPKEQQNKDFHQETAGIRHLLTKDKEQASCWRPSLSFHGIEGAYDGPGEKTVIPAKVIGKFSIRTGPGQRPGIIAGVVDRHIRQTFKCRNSPNRIVIRYAPTEDISKV